MLWSNHQNDSDRTSSNKYSMIGYLVEKVFCSSGIAKLVRHATLNRRRAGSNPAIRILSATGVKYGEVA